MYLDKDNIHYLAQEYNELMQERHFERCLGIMQKIGALPGFIESVHTLQRDLLELSGYQYEEDDARSPRVVSEYGIPSRQTNGSYTLTARWEHEGRTSTQAQEDFLVSKGVRIAVCPLAEKGAYRVNIEHTRSPRTEMKDGKEIYTPGGWYPINKEPFTITDAHQGYMTDGFKSWTTAAMGMSEKIFDDTVNDSEDSTKNRGSVSGVISRPLVLS